MKVMWMNSKKKLGIFEDGRASVRVVDFIEEKLNANI